MNKLLCSIVCIGALSSIQAETITSNAYFSAEYNLSSHKKASGLDYTNDRIDNYKLSLQNFKMSENDTNIAWYFNLGSKRYNTSLSDNKNSSGFNEKSLYFDVLLGPSINLSDENVKSSLNLLLGVNTQRYKNTFSGVTENINTNSFKVGISTLNEIDNGLMIGLEAFAKIYIDSNREKLFDGQSNLFPKRKKTSAETNLMLGYKLLSAKNGEGIFTGVKVGYQEDLISKGANFGLTFGYMF